MPLPDERPRQSVANLIGRFETQTKRLSLSASSPSRSSSVVSHITGDSAKEELKEKREWPPKAAPTPEKPPLILPSLSSRNILSAQVTQSSSNGSDLGLDNNRKITTTEDLEVPLTAKALNASQRQAKGEPNSFLENWRKDLPSSQVDLELEDAPPTATPQHPEVATPTPSSAQKSGVSAAPRTPISKVANKAPVVKHPATKPAATKPPPSAAAKAIAVSSKTPAKTPAKPPTLKEPATPSLTPLKPQHTGQSTSSATASRRPIAKASGNVPKTPSRPDSTSRSKTPTSARPKTPSSGLFAPTAASLARSRNAAPAMPTPVKKTALSSSSLDRLSKPTAASQAKVAASQAKVAAASPPPASRRVGTSAPRPSTTAKPKTSASPSKAKKPSTGPSAAAAAAGAGAAIVASVVSGDDADANGESQEHQEPEEHVEILPSEESHEVLEEHSNTGETSKDAEEVPQIEVAQEDTKQDPQSVDSDNEATPISPSPAPEAEHSEDTQSSTVEDDVLLSTPSNNEAKDDLEDIVNLLETVSVKQPVQGVIITAANIPDEILEIPNEEDK